MNKAQIFFVEYSPKIDRTHAIANSKIEKDTLVTCEGVNNKCV